jgi:hypothetical protein
VTLLLVFLSHAFTVLLNFPLLTLRGAVVARALETATCRRCFARGGGGRRLAGFSLTFGSWPLFSKAPSFSGIVKINELIRIGCDQLIARREKHVTASFIDAQEIRVDAFTAS